MRSPPSQAFFFLLSEPEEVDPPDYLRVLYLYDINPSKERLICLVVEIKPGAMLKLQAAFLAGRLVLDDHEGSGEADHLVLTIPKFLGAPHLPVDGLQAFSAPGLGVQLGLPSIGFCTVLFRRSCQSLMCSMCEYLDFQNSTSAGELTL